MNRNYQEPSYLPREEAEAVFSGRDHQAICQALVDVTFTDQDRQWVESLCVRLSRHPEADVRGLVATCLGHLARIHREIDLESARGVLDQLAHDSDASVVARTEEAWDDIRMFTGQLALPSNAAPSADKPN